MSQTILVLYYSRNGSVAQLARLLARGIEETNDMQARVRQTPPVAPVTRTVEPPDPGTGAPYVEHRDLAECAALALGSPTRFGNMAAPLKHFLDTTGAEWGSGVLAGKPAAVFTSTSSMHGGQESTLLSMMLPLLHHGALLVGIPYTESAISTTRSGGSPYGATHWSGADGEEPITDEERTLARALGRRLGDVTRRLERSDEY